MKRKDELIKIVKYIFSAGTSFIIDLVFFTIINTLLGNILQNEAIIIATISARILSSLYNYYINSRIVFKKYNKSSIIKYYILVIVQMFISAIIVYLISKAISNISDTIIKFFVDIMIFIVNYLIQRRYIFR